VSCPAKWNIEESRHELKATTLRKNAEKAVAAIGLAISMLFEDENAGMMRGGDSRTRNRGP